MRTELNLKGNELLLYALIYGYTENSEHHCYYGTIEYMMEWLGASEKTVHTTINKLISKGLLEKTIMGSQKVGNRCYYKANRAVKITDQSVEITDQSVKMTDNNIEYNIDNNIDKNEIMEFSHRKSKVNFYDCLDTQVDRVCNKLGYSKDIINDVKSFINMFYGRYEHEMGEKHPLLKDDILMHCIDDLLGNENTYNLDTDSCYELIDAYFNSSFGNYCDYHLPHFAMDGIIQNRFYERLY